MIHKIEQFWGSHTKKIVLFLIISIFMAYSVFIAINLDRNIIPDEPAHFTFSKHYSSTWDIPPDVPETYTLGWYIYRNPFLYYWINGRIINVLELIKPNISQWQMLVALRLVNVIYGLGTVLFCFFLSKELIKHEWWSLLPVFLLTNTLMFVFLVGGVNYDNLANLFSMAGLFFFVRVLGRKDFLTNSFGWIISIFAGTLVKFTLLPLGLILSIIWAVFFFKNKNQIFPIVFSIKRVMIFGGLFIIVLFGNLATYGYNLITYRSITPDCTDIITIEQCRISPYVQRYEALALDQKLTISESINQGYPDPLTYLVDSWFPNILYRVYGIAGHLAYWPKLNIIFFRILLFWIFLLAIKYWKRPALSIVSSIIIFLFYSIVLFQLNYNSELIYGFIAITLQGRYFFPVIGLFYCLIAYFLMTVPSIHIRKITLGGTILLFLMSGPIKFIQHYNTYFLNWFIK